MYGVPSTGSGYGSNGEILWTWWWNFRFVVKKDSWN